MKFVMTANIQFEADGIDDAFRALEAHFKALRKGLGSDLIQQGGIDIRPQPPLKGKVAG